AIRGLAAGVVIAALVVAGLVYSGRIRGEGLASKLLVADTTQVSAIIDEIDAAGRWTWRELERVARDQRRSPKERLHASLALLPRDGAHGEYLVDRLLQCQPDELIVIAHRLQGGQQALADRIWVVACDPRALPGARFRAACALATLAPEDG